MRKTLEILCSAIVFAALAVPASAQATQVDPDQTTRGPLLSAMLACRQITGESERLTCFDRTTAAFDAAERQGEVTVLDRAQVRETRTRLFGLDLDNLNVFDRATPTDRIESLETTLTSARRNGEGQWSFTLEDGSVWRQIDTERLTVSARPGAPVRIRQGAVGSYLLSVNGSRSVRAKRER